MERKLLWVISCIVIFILWIKTDPQSTSPAPAQESSDAAVKTDAVTKSDAPTKPKEQSKPKTNAEIDPPVKAKLKEGQTAQDKNSETPVTEQEKAYFKSHPINGDTPNFAEIADIPTRKDAFFNFLTPFVHEKNALQLEDRARIEKILAKGQPFSEDDISWISAQRSIHRLKKVDEYAPEHIQALLKYVDIIPASLVLAQAANESAWGTSRFATEGNNYFGQWCFRKGCGLVPNSRSDDADHEVRKFNDARESVFAYIDNLNSNPAYRELRDIRAGLRANENSITGLALVHGLEKYSERGQEYVDEIESLIDYNELWRFNVHTDNDGPNE